MSEVNNVDDFFSMENIMKNVPNKDIPIEKLDEIQEKIDSCFDESEFYEMYFDSTDYSSSKMLLVFPFIWENNINNLTFNKMVDIFEKNKAWANDDYYCGVEKKENAYDNEAINFVYENNVSIYNTFLLQQKTFFYRLVQPAVRDLVFGKISKSEDNILDIVRNFYIEAIRPGIEGSQYKIKVRDDSVEYSSDVVEYDVKIHDVRLKIYNTGIALLILDGEYIYNDDSTVMDIVRVNGYARYFNVGQRTYYKLSEIGEKHSGVEYSSMLHGGGKLDANYISEALLFFLNYSNDNDGVVKFTPLRALAEENPQKYKFIIPAIETEMFLFCQLGNNILGITDNELKEYINFIAENGGKTSETKFSTIEKNLYNMLCSKHMPNTIFSEEEYKNGKDFNDFPYYKRGILKDAFFPDPRNENDRMFVYENTVLNIFSLENERSVDNISYTYSELCNIVLAQRASLRVMNIAASRLTSEIEKLDKDINQELTRKITDLQEKYIEFQNQINLYDISTDVYLSSFYNKLRDSFGITDTNNALKEQLNSLYSMANIHQSEKLNSYAAAIAIIAGLFALPSFLGDFSKTDDWNDAEPIIFRIKMIGFFLCLLLIPFVRGMIEKIARIWPKKASKCYKIIKMWMHS